MSVPPFEFNARGDVVPPRDVAVPDYVAQQHAQSVAPPASFVPPVAPPDRVPLDRARAALRAAGVAVVGVAVEQTDWEAGRSILGGRKQRLVTTYPVRWRGWLVGEHTWLHRRGERGVALPDLRMQTVLLDADLSTMDLVRTRGLVPVLSVGGRWVRDQGTLPPPAEEEVEREVFTMTRALSQE